MKISGQAIIALGQTADSHTAKTQELFVANNPRTGEALSPSFYSSGPDEVNLAATLANKAFAIYGRSSGRERGKFLRTIADKIDGAVDALVERAELESALPKPRLIGETARTSGQLRLFAEVAEEGSWVMPPDRSARCRSQTCS